MQGQLASSQRLSRYRCVSFFYRMRRQAEWNVSKPIGNRFLLTLVSLFVAFQLEAQTNRFEFTIHLAAASNTVATGQSKNNHRVLKILIPFGSKWCGAFAEPLGKNLEDVADKSRSPTTVNLECVSLQRMSGSQIALMRFPSTSVNNPAERFARDWNVVCNIRATSDQPKFSLGDRITLIKNVGTYVDNPESLSTYQDFKIEHSTSSKTSGVFLVIAPRQFLDAFTPLLEKKAAEGIATNSFAIETIATNEMGRDLAEKMRNYIRRQYETAGVQWVLIGGDGNVMPCRHAYVPRSRPAAECQVATDLYFGCLDGSWNRDDDMQWGEPNDGEDGGEVDLLAEVEIGRVPVATKDEATTWVKKAIQIQSATVGISRSVVLAGASLEQGDAQAGRIGDLLRPYLAGFNIKSLDDRSIPWRAGDAVAALNQSPDIVVYNGHATSDSMLRLAAEDVSRLSNRIPFLLVSAACDAGEFTSGIAGESGIGVRLLKLPHAGAHAASLNSREGWYDSRQESRYSGEFQIQFFRHLAEIPSVDLGWAHQAAKHDLCGKVEKSGSMPYRWCYFSLNYFGDPQACLNPATTNRTAMR